MNIERWPGPDIAVKTDHYSHGNNKPLKDRNLKV